MGFLFFVVFLAFLGLAGFMACSSNNKQLVIQPSRAYLGLLLAAITFVVWVGYVTVDAGTMGVVTRQGAVVRTIPPGPHFITPFLEQVHEISTRTLVVKPNEDAASHDLQVVHMQVTLAYHFDPAHVAYIYSQLSDASEGAVENKVVIPAILEAMKANAAQYDAQQLISERPVVRDGIEAFLQKKLKDYYIIPETVSITDFNFSKDYNAAIEAKQTAEQESEQAENILKKVKIEAEQKIASANGEAAALRAQKEQITPELLQLRMIEMLREKWDGRLPENYYGGASPLPIVGALTGAKK
jgi:regulator of protease activity HflC (stomatin/prohibitin superfamily)